MAPAFRKRTATPQWCSQLLAIFDANYRLQARVHVRLREIDPKKRGPSEALLSRLAHGKIGTSKWVEPITFVLHELGFPEIDLPPYDVESPEASEALQILRSMSEPRRKMALRVLRQLQADRDD